MKFILASGLNMYANWKQTETVAVVADKLGYWGLVMPDHYMWGPRMGGDSTVETWTALTYLAAKTENLRFGTLVTPIPFRPPGMLAKTVSTLDLLSGGRTILGVGAGWSRTEFEGYSQWEPNKVRVEKTEEGLQLILKLWTEEKVTFKGKYFHANGAVLDPKPQQKPHPPLLFGGVGPRMLRMAGRHADICLIPAFPGVDNAKSRKIVMDEARRHRREGKISIADIAPFPSPGSKYDQRDYQRRIEEAAKAGSMYFITPFPPVGYMEAVTGFAKDVIPSFASQEL